jgi:hypothetical protein
MFSSEQWLANSGADFYNGVATTSVRLAGDSYLTLDNAGSATSTQKCTLSCWFKRTELTVLSNIFHSANDSGGASFGISLDAADSISVTQYSGASPFSASAYDFGVTVAPRKFRDTSAWYHLVVTIDTTLGSGTTNEADRIKIYINGTRQTVVATSDGSGSQDFADEDQTVASFQDGKQRWGATVTGSQIAHIYLAECNGVDGLALDASYFGETKNGVWIPIAPNVSEYGNHGFRLQFTSTAHDAPASLGSADTDNIGADSSGKNNHFTAVDAIGTHDCAMPDSPENNFATLNPLDDDGHTNAEGNLKVSGNVIYGHEKSTFAVTSGKWYFEGKLATQQNDTGIGLANQNASTLSHYLGQTADSVGYVSDGRFFYNGSSTSYTSWTTTDVGQIAFDADTGEIWIGKNNTWMNSGNPANGTGEVATVTWNEFIVSARTVGSGAMVFNFGQDASFAGALTGSAVGDETDGNGYGLFKYAPPNLFLSLCTANLEEPTIGANSLTQADDHIQTITYIGNGGTIVIPNNDETEPTTPSSMSFSPDFTWYKCRTGGANRWHYLFDTSRGEGKALYSNLTYYENQESVINAQTFETNGTKIVRSSGDHLNNDNDTYVAWNWKAGGTPTATNSAGAGNTPTAGSVKIDGVNLGSALAGTIPATKISANTTSGFSIVTYTGTGTAGTIAHGLGAIPNMYMVKCLDNSASTDHWYVYHAGIASNAEDYEIYLNLTARAYENNNYPWNETKPTNSVFSIKTLQDVNQSSKLYVAYVFADVEGYSKMGAYIAVSGSGSTPNNDGVFVYLGFRPAWIMIKYTGSGAWNIHDNTRSLINPMQNYLMPASSEAEATTEALEFLSNGVKMRSASGFFDHPAGGDFIYMAFAEQPFKYANAR